MTISPLFGANVTVTDDAKKSLVERDGIAANAMLKELQTLLEGGLDEYKEMDVLIDNDAFFENVKGGLAVKMLDTVELSGQPTDPETSEKLEKQKETVWVLEEGETAQQIAEGVIETAKAFAKKFNIQ